MPTLSARLLLVFLVLLALPGRAPADEAGDDERRAAAAIGRDLLALDAAVRERAVQRLLARIEQGGELGPFLEAMGAAVKGWADHRERLLDLWIEKAVRGSAGEREQAARLIHALGAEAVERLLEELRHARGMQPEADKPEAAPRESAHEAPPPAGADEPPVCCNPQVYHVLDLGKLGMNPVEVRSLLQKTPDAREVKEIGRGIYVVTASTDGHAALRAALGRLRARGETLPQQAVPVEGVARWRVTPIVYRVSRSVVAPPKGQYGVTPQQAGAVLPRATRPDETEVHVGTGMDAAIWMKLLQHGANGVRGETAEGPASVLVGETGRYVQGREQRYRKGVVRADDGWTIEEGTLQVGIEFDVTLGTAEDHVDVYLRASRSEVATPMLVDTIQPEPKGTTYELDRPEWIITKARATFEVPLTGGAAFLSLGDLGSTDEEHVIVILRIQPVP